ncbi:MAG: ATP phosphoribosyltransferase regulatory subunit, partial [Pseudomonadota bacterium]
RIGDLGLFQALLNALDLPKRWRERLRAQFWQPDSFRAELRQMTTQPAARIEGIPRDLIDALQGCDQLAAEHVLITYLDENGVPAIGARSIHEIAANLLAAMEDALSDALPESTAQIIERYLQVVAPARAAGARLGDLIDENGIDISDALATYQRRLKFLSSVDIDPARVEFRAEFGRSLEYYTGFVFEVVSDHVGPQSPIAGGGRYDTLMRIVGATSDVPAVGAMIHTERLLAAAEERPIGEGA